MRCHTPNEVIRVTYIPGKSDSPGRDVGTKHLTRHWLHANSDRDPYSHVVPVSHPSVCSHSEFRSILIQKANKKRAKDVIALAKAGVHATKARADSSLLQLRPTRHQALSIPTYFRYRSLFSHEPSSFNGHSSKNVVKPRLNEQAITVP